MFWSWRLPLCAARLKSCFLDATYQTCIWLAMTADVAGRNTRESRPFALGRQEIQHAPPNWIGSRSMTPPPTCVRLGFWARAGGNLPRQVRAPESRSALRTLCALNPLCHTSHHHVMHRFCLPHVRETFQLGAWCLGSAREEGVPGLYPGACASMVDAKGHARVAFQRLNLSVRLSAQRRRDGQQETRNHCLPCKLHP